MEMMYKLILKGVNDQHDIICIFEHNIICTQSFITICKTLHSWGFDDKSIEFFVEQVLVKDDPRIVNQHNVTFSDGRKVQLHTVSTTKFYFEPERK